MATPSLSPKLALGIAQRQRHAVIVLAIQRAKRSMQRQLQAQGIKLASVSARDISHLAEAYLAQHRHELIAEAMTTVERWTARGMFGKRAQRAWADAESVRNRRLPNAAYRQREYLTESEVDRLIEAARKRGRNGPRDAAAILLSYRHGLRAQELCSLTLGAD
jgi:site-specific recombinase XerD